MAFTVTKLVLHIYPRKLGDSLYRKEESILKVKRMIEKVHEVRKIIG